MNESMIEKSKSLDITVWKIEKFSLTEKIFHEISSLVTSLVKPLLSRNFWQKSVRENFNNFNTVDITVWLKIFTEFKFRENNWFCRNFFLGKNWPSWFDENSVIFALRITELIDGRKSCIHQNGQFHVNYSTELSWHRVG